MRPFSHKTGKLVAKTRKAFRHQKVDRALTASKHFLDHRSFCNLRGESFLAGEDMRVMHDAVMARDKWRCVHCGQREPCTCHSPLEVHHRKHRGQGGSDDLDNLETICGHCHRLRHPQVQFGRPA